MSKSKIVERAFYQPGESSIEGWPTTLQFFYAHPPVMLMPHWHAQVEVNYVISGSVRYRMGDMHFHVNAGQMCLFWGGQPHQLDESSDDSFYAGAHVPLFHFFRMRLPATVSAMLMGGAALMTEVTGKADDENFQRWQLYLKSGDATKADNAIEELILRVERMFMEPYRVLTSTSLSDCPSPHEATASSSVVRMCDFIAAHFLDDIDATDIARAANLHPKYAMNVFRKATGMTLIKYLTLLRLSRAQAMLVNGRDNILNVAMESGFGSVSAFNKAFRQFAGIPPSDFRRGSNEFFQ